MVRVLLFSNRVFIFNSPTVHISSLQPIFVCLPAALKQKGEPKLPAGHPMPPQGQAVASKCPFLAAEMGQKNSGVVRQVAMEFQEDVQEVRTVQKGRMTKNESGFGPWFHIEFNIYLCLSTWAFPEVSPDQLKSSSLASAPRAGVQTNLLNTLLKQRPKGVTHLMQDNLPGRSKS